jgi:Uma2 family endonuclease
MFAMAGGSPEHTDIAVQLIALLWQHLRGKDCRVHNSDIRVLVETSGLYTYPDISVTCGQRHFVGPRKDTLTNPILLVEVLSPSTERYDRHDNLRMYRSIPSLQECLLIAQDQHDVELYRRQPDGTWSVIDAKGRDASIELTSIGYHLRLRELYETAFPEPA